MELWATRPNSCVPLASSVLRLALNFARGKSALRCHESYGGEKDNSIRGNDWLISYITSFRFQVQSRPHSNQQQQMRKHDTTGRTTANDRTRTRHRQLAYKKEFCSKELGDNDSLFMCSAGQCVVDDSLFEDDDPLSSPTLSPSTGHDRSAEGRYQCSGKHTVQLLTHTFCMMQHVRCVFAVRKLKSFFFPRL